MGVYGITTRTSVSALRAYTTARYCKRYNSPTFYQGEET